MRILFLSILKFILCDCNIAEVFHIANRPIFSSIYKNNISWKTLKENSTNIGIKIAGKSKLLFVKDNKIKNLKKSQRIIIGEGSSIVK